MTHLLDITPRYDFTKGPNGASHYGPWRIAPADWARLFDALIGLLGYQAANEIPSLEEYADTLITDCLIGRVEVVDTEAA